MKKSLLLFFLMITGQVVAAPMGSWKPNSSPLIMDKKFNMTFSELPLVGQAVGSKKFWSNYYWPLFKGSINYRWNSPNPTGFNLDSPGYSEAKKLGLKGLKILSPAEKYDLLMGKYTYPLRNQVKRRASPRRKEWEGICHGWAQAALNHNEPTPKVLTNPDGLEVPFGSSDIKALLSYYYAYHYRPVSIYQMGRRCNGKNHCEEDMNAGAFHVVLANRLGLEGKGFIADIDNGREVWNQVAYNYISMITAPDLPPARTSAKGTVRVVRVQTRMRVVFNIVENSWTTVIGTPFQTYKDMYYEYDLELNARGKIIGGQWISKVRPDFLWTVKPVRSFSGHFSGMKRLLNDQRRR